MSIEPQIGNKEKLDLQDNVAADHYSIPPPPPFPAINSEY